MFSPNLASLGRMVQEILDRIGEIIKNTKVLLFIWYNVLYSLDITTCTRKCDGHSQFVKHAVNIMMYGMCVIIFAIKGQNT